MFASADEFLKSDQVPQTSCLITDVRMPGLSGLELQDRLIARGHQFPIIFINRAKAMEAGAAGFLNKPMHSENLLDYLAKALRRSGSCGGCCGLVRWQVHTRQHP